MSLVQIGALIVKLESVDIIPTNKGGVSKYDLVVNGNHKWTFESDTDEGEALVKWIASKKNVEVIAPHELIEEARPKAEDHMKAIQQRIDIQNGGARS